MTTAVGKKIVNFAHNFAQIERLKVNQGLKIKGKEGEWLHTRVNMKPMWKHVSRIQKVRSFYARFSP